MFDVFANRLLVSSPSTSLLSWLISSVSQTARKSLKVSVRMKEMTTEGVTNTSRYTVITAACVLFIISICAFTIWLLYTILLFPQSVDSEDSDVDTGFYSDGDDTPPTKRKSLLVALRCETKDWTCCQSLFMQQS